MYFIQMLHFVQNKKDHHDSTKYYLSTIHTYTVFPWKLFFFESGKCGNFYVVFALWQFFTSREEITRGNTVCKPSAVHPNY